MTLTEQVRTQHAQQLLAGIREAAGRLPLADGGLGDIAETGHGSGAAELFDDLSDVHGPILRTLRPKRNRHSKDFSEYPNWMLKDRLRRAMDGPPKVSQVALAKACGVTGPAVNDWLSGKSKTMRGEYLVAAARFLEVSADWLASGRGPMRVNGSAQGQTENKSQGESGTPSHSLGLDRGILHEALTLLFYDEMHAGDYTPHARTDRLAELYGWVAADGGRLTKSRNAAFVQQVDERNREARGINGSDTSVRRPTGRKGAAG